MNKYDSNKFNKEKLIRLIICVIAIIAVVLILLFVANCIEKKVSPITDNNVDGVVTRKTEDSAGEDDRVYIDGQWYRYKSEIRTTLLIGIDDFGQIRENDIYNNSHQADFLLLLAKDDKTGDVFSIQINRDTMTSVNALTVSGESVGRNEEQIALAYAYGGGGTVSCENTMDAVSYFLYGLPMEKYIAMSMSGIGVLNDEVGGVTLPMLCDFPQLGYKKDEVVTLNADEALVYVRARSEMEDPTNIARMERQRQYILAWSDIAKDKFKSVKAATQLIEHIEPYLCTNCDSVTLANMAQELSEYKGAPIYVPEGETIYEGTAHGFAEFRPDEEKLKSLILDLFYEKLDE